ncbi:ATP-binding protein [Streptomyces sp. NPDC101219]|uniref:ATP-binding protein n=1 Tax=Streptomyces sp. NPDC101219 TaxID=3366131 RepID=UPI0038040A4D
MAVSVLFEAGAEIGEARDIARDFLRSVQATRGVPVSAQAIGLVQLVVSELVTNARKYAPGACLLDLVFRDGAVQVGVWDSSTTLPSVRGRDPHRVGRHGLELVRAVCRTFHVHREGTGKRITALVRLADDPGTAHPAPPRPGP